MKKIFYTILIISALSVFAFGQSSLTKDKEVYFAKDFTFYGYDFTHFKLSDPKRIGQNIKNFVFVWIDFCNKPVNAKDLAKWFKKDEVTIDQAYTLEINMKLNNDELGTFKRFTFPKDSIQSYVNKYDIQEKDGIGFVIIYECFDKESKTISAYYTFFDIATKEVLLCDYFVSRDKNGYNYVRDWCNAMIIAMKKYSKEYRGRVKLL